MHWDFNVCHYAKSILDEVFGAERFRNEVVWKRTSAHANVLQRYGNVHDVLFLYTKTESFTWIPQFTPYTDEYIKTFFVANYVTVDLFVKALRNVVVEEQVPQLVAARRLSETPPFPFSRPQVFSASQNCLQPCGVRQRLRATLRPFSPGRA